ncbi:MAG TPA: hypothetical protein VIU39_03220 [Anaerolineales bacterium]
MNIPRPTLPLVIVAEDEQRRAIRFITTEDVLQAIRDRQYGRIEVIDPDAGEYELIVSPLYPDYHAVFDWIGGLAA